MLEIIRDCPNPQERVALKSTQARKLLFRWLERKTTSEQVLLVE